MITWSEVLQQTSLSPIIRNGDYAVRHPWSYPVSRLLDYLLVYFQEGHCRFTVEGEAYDFYQGDFCLIQPTSLYSMRGLTNSITPFVHMDIFYNPYRGDCFSTRPGLTDLSEFAHLVQPRLNDLEGINIPVKLRPQQPIQFRDLFLKMVSEANCADPVRQLKSQVLASQLVIQILEDHSEPQQSKKDETEMPALNWITSYLSFNLSEPLSIKTMAERAHLSPSRFNALFREEFGIPPYQYLLQLRIEHAKVLLRTTDLTITDIASYCGFNDIHHFSKIFKEKSGESPLRFRQTTRTM